MINVEKHAFVSGSTSGIGLNIAEKLLESGYVVWINGRSEEKGSEVLAELSRKYESVRFLCGDVCKKNDMQTITEEFRKHQVSLSLIVANVGSGRASNDLVVGNEEFQHVWHVNFCSAVNVCQFLLPLLLDKANIVCISSIAGVAPIGAPIPYACAKAALNMFVKEWAIRLAGRGITVNSICPGNVLFPESVWQKKLESNRIETEEYIQSNVPMNKFIHPTEIASMVVHLTQQPSMTGQNIVIDAGQIK